MARLLVIGVVAVVVLTVFSIVDCALTERAAVRALPRWTWLLVVLLLPLVGPLLWLTIGHQRTQPVRFLAPDDDPAFSGRPGAIRHEPVLADEEELRLLEQELAKLDSDAEDDGDGLRRN